MLEPLTRLFPVAVSLHNLEEGSRFPSYAHLFRLWRAVGAKAFRFALVVLTALAYLTGGPRSLGAYLLVGYMLAVLLNVFVPHLMVSSLQRQLMPGTVTGVLLVGPIAVTGLCLGLRSGYLEPQTLVLYGIGVTAALLASLPLLFRLGNGFSPTPLLSGVCGSYTPSAPASGVRRHGRRAWR